MEQYVKLNTEQPSLLMLDDHCLLQIFEFLSFEDSMNLAESCNRLRQVAESIFKKYSKVAVDSIMMGKGIKHIERVFSYVGRHVLSLKIHYTETGCADDIILSTIINSCDELKNTIIEGFVCRNDTSSDSDSLVYRCDNVEMLTLFNCMVNVSFLENFRKLKYLNVRKSRLHGKIGTNQLTTVLENLEEMQLQWANFDDDIIDKLTLFKKLTLFNAAYYRNVELEPIVWPANLKRLRLWNFKLTFNGLVSMIGQLKSLECLDLFFCDVIYSDIDRFEDLTVLSQQIVTVMVHGDDKQQLNLILPESARGYTSSYTEKYLTDTEHLKILNSKCANDDPFGIEIYDVTFRSKNNYNLLQ